MIFMKNKADENNDKVKVNKGGSQIEELLNERNKELKKIADSVDHSAVIDDKILIELSIHKLEKILFLAWNILIALLSDWAVDFESSLEKSIIEELKGLYNSNDVDMVNTFIKRVHDILDKKKAEN